LKRVLKNPDAGIHIYPPQTQRLSSTNKAQNHSSTYMRIIFFLFTLLFQIHLLSQTLHLSLGECDPDCIVRNVNVITGELLLSETDSTVHGPVEIDIHRSYRSQEGWNYFPHTLFLLGGGNEQEKDCSEMHYKAFSGEKSGSILTYLGSISKGSDGELRCSDNGLVNCTGEEISGRTNLANNRALYRAKDETIEIITGNGTRRIYVKGQQIETPLYFNVLDGPVFKKLSSLLQNPIIFFLQREICPNGNKILYSYDASGRLKNISGRSCDERTVFWTVAIDYEAESTVLISTSGDKKIQYLFDTEKPASPLLTAVQTQAGTTRYAYESGLLIRKNFPDQTVEEVSYFDDEEAKGRVQSLSSAKEYFYFLYNLSSENPSTTAIDQQKNTTTYRYANKRLRSIDTFTSSSSFVHGKRKFFGTGSLSSFLVSEAIEDRNHQIVSCTTYQYDTNGNVEEERVYGDLVGKQIPLINLQANGIPEPDAAIPCHAKKRTYSRDGFNLLLSQGDTKKGKIRYEYKPGTNLMTAQYVYDDGSIKKRTFFEYDTYGSLIRQTCDDSSSDYRHSQSFSEQQIAETTASAVYPFGLPIIVTEKYFDKAARKETVLKKTINTYTTSGLLVSTEVEGATGERKLLCASRYDNQDRLIQQTDAKGIIRSYTYGANGLLETEERGNVIFRYSYDQNKNLIKKEEIYPNGIRFEEVSEYDCFGNMIFSTDIFGNATSSEYDSFNRLIKTISPKVYDKQSGMVHPQWVYTYDLFNRIASIQDPKGQITRFFYTIRGNRSRIEYPDGSKDQFSYDVEGSLHREATRDGIIRIYLYDFLGRTTKIERFEQSEKGPGELLGERAYIYSLFHLTLERDERGYVITHSYDYAGRLVMSEGTSGWKKREKRPKAVFEYDSFGRIFKTKEWIGDKENEYRTTLVAYDSYDRVITSTVEDADGVVILQKKYSYNENGDLLETSSQGHVDEIIEYNDLHEPVKRIDEANNEWRFTYEYAQTDEWGQRVYSRSVINPLGTQKTYLYDPRGALTSVFSKDSNGKVIEKSSFFYDLLMNTSEEIHTCYTEEGIEQEQRISRSHDSMGRLLTIEKHNEQASTATTFVYDQRGRISKRYESGLQSPIQYSYRNDLYGSHVRVMYPINRTVTEASKNQNDFPFYDFTFDPEGLVTDIFSSESVQIQREYGFLKQVLQEHISLHGRTCSNTPIKTKCYIDRCTDALGRTTEIQLPDQSSILYTYKGSFLKEVSRLSSEGAIQYVHTYDEYDQHGNVSKETLIGDLGKRTTESDACSRKMGVTTQFYKEHISANGFDPLGNIVSSLKENPIQSVLCTYTYDSLSRLISEEGFFNHTYSCDSLGNQRKFDRDEYTFNGFNQLTSGPCLTCTYDKGGCLSLKTTSDGSVSFTYDTLHHLTKIKSGSQEVNYVYDGLGRKILQKQSSNSQTSVFLYLGDEEIGLATTEGKLLQLKVPGLENCIAFELGDVVVSPIYDMQDNVVCIVDPKTKAVKETYEYSAFGEERIYDEHGNEIDRSFLDNPWRFFGKRKEKISGLIFFGVRDYDPQTRRWTAPDPLGAIDSPNLYLYALGNPINYRDDFGFSSRGFYATYKNFQAYLESDRRDNRDRGGDLGAIEHRTSPDYPRTGSVVKIYSLKYTQEKVIEKLKHDPAFSQKVIAHINGIDTTEETVYMRANRMIRNSNEKIDAVMIVYNKTEGLFKDLLKANKDIHHVGSHNFREIKQALMEFFENFRGTSVKIAFHCHSHGAAIMDNLMRTPEFSKATENGYKQFLGPIFTYGGATLIQSATNFIARFDFVPLLNTENKQIMNNHPECIHYLDFRFQSPWTAHGFDSPSYQEAFQIAINM
jgi:RHS repeat-associated protein